tara:strand:+ start:563 stop:1378 length:816 start_codon:yes stop_codon:yes gene_type:complete
MPVTIYCQNFDCDERVTASGELLYRDDGSPVTYDVSMSAYVPVSWLKEAFKYKSSGDDVSEETAIAGYITKNSRTNQHSFVIDASHAFSDYNQEGTHSCDLDFVRQLAVKMFGSVHGVDLMSNESAVATAYQAAVIDCGDTISGYPTAYAKIDSDNSTSGGAGQGTLTINTNIDMSGGTVIGASDTSGNGAAAAMDILCALLQDASGRFQNPTGSEQDMPFVDDDKLKMIFTISAPTDQIDISGNSLSSFNRKVLVTMIASSSVTTIAKSE